MVVLDLGSALIIGGVNKKGCRLFETDPGGGALIEQSYCYRSS